MVRRGSAFVRWPTSPNERAADDAEHDENRDRCDSTHMNSLVEEESPVPRYGEGSPPPRGSRAPRGYAGS